MALFEAMRLIISGMRYAEKSSDGQSLLMH
jgi:hypothetical protein